MDETLRRVLSAYDIIPRTCRPAGGTAGAAWRVVGRDGGAHFVRRRGARTSSPERIRFDHGLRMWLADAGFCAYPPRMNRDGATWVVIDDDVFEVYPWVDGRLYEASIAGKAREHAARALSAFHNIARGYDAECEPVVPQFTHYPVPIEQHEHFDAPQAFLQVIDHVRRTWATAADLDRMRTARERAQWLLETYEPLRARLPRSVIHGDYNCFNLLFDDGGRVVGVFDYDWAWRDVRVRDIGEGMFFFGARRRAPADSGDIWALTACPEFSIDPMLEFLDAYESQSPLSPDERRAVPLAMLGRWVACRTEGVIKVPEHRRADFLLQDFDRPFDWLMSEGRALLRL